MKTVYKWPWFGELWTRESHTADLSTKLFYNTINMVGNLSSIYHLRKILACVKWRMCWSSEPLHRPPDGGRMTSFLFCSPLSPPFLEHGQAHSRRSVTTCRVHDGVREPVSWCSPRVWAGSDAEEPGLSPEELSAQLVWASWRSAAAFLTDFPGEVVHVWATSASSRSKCSEVQNSGATLTAQDTSPSPVSADR